MHTWFIAEGQLACADAQGATLAVLSPFVQEAVQRHERSRQVDGWKTASAPDDDRGRMVSRATLWGSGAAATAPLQPRFRHVARGADGWMYYVVTLGRGTGLFRQHLQEGREVRLFHGAAMECLGIAYDPASDRLVMASGNADGTACLELVDAEGNRRGAITGGDSIDAAPSVSAREPGVVYFQSSGVARHAQTGAATAIGPAAILRLDTRTAQLATVVERNDVDYLCPKEDGGGNLWYIRRPYERTAGEVAVSSAKDALLFPWRVVKGVFGFLDTFSRIYGREPLKPTGGPQNHNLQPDMGALWLHGRMVALREVRYENGRGGGLVPGSWELVCRNRRGDEFVSARHVVSFDIAPDGTPIHSNGFEVFRLVDGDWRPLVRGNLVETVCAGSA